MADTKILDEAARLAALQRYEVLDTQQEASFDRITALVKAVLNVPACLVSLVDADRQWFKSNIGFSACETPRGISFCTHAIMERQPLLIPDAASDPRFMQNPLVVGPPFIRSYLGAPLATPDGYNVGSLCVFDTVPRSYSSEQVQILENFAALVVDEMELRRIAHTDHLTGAVARRAFLLELERALVRFNRSGSPAALLMLDLDHFKQVNDTYGHPVGDRVLRSVTDHLIGHLRQSDVVGRLGGEELGVLLPDTTEASALQTAERLRSSLESIRLEGDAAIRITASFGIAPLGGELNTPQQWMASADRALYRAKRGGRNRCCMAQDSCLQMPLAAQHG